jgi:c-di-GMP-binding flagellar brake protein YcgR
MSINRRQYPRVRIHVPVTYALLEEQRKTGPEAIGIALDVSLGGLLLESFDFVATEYVGVSFIDIENQVVQIECKMVYSRKTDLGTDQGLVHTGLSFQGTEVGKADFAAKIIRAYFYRRKRLAGQIVAPTRFTAVAGCPLDLV